MGFASTYLKERSLFPEKIKEAPDRETGIIIVVPAYNEPEINKLLDSLAQCRVPECKVEVIIVINAPENATIESIENNKITLNNIESWKKENNNCFFRLFAFIIGQSSVTGWGVGLARKTGMDEALRRFSSINNPDGVILNLDADCIVEKNYLLAIYSELLKKSDRAACSIYFEHPLSGSNYPESIYKYITFYELHLRYYLQGLAYSGFPYVFHTVGSAIAVKALPYVKSGGMNRRQAGEDFYFVQKLVPAGGYFNLNTTTVYPSPRPSSRVPFGTGASIEKLDAYKSSTLLTYNIMAFKELHTFFGLTDVFFESSPEELHKHFSLIPQGLRLFLDENEWIAKMMEIKNNTSGILSFKKRFFGWFNMFRIVKYLNNVHIDFFEKKPVDISASELLEVRGSLFESKEPHDLLLHYRMMEKNS
jgi:Glycosyl transferase family group 2